MRPRSWPLVFVVALALLVDRPAICQEDPPAEAATPTVPRPLARPSYRLGPRALEVVLGPPGAETIHAVVPLPSPSYDLLQIERRLYIAAGSAGVLIFDVSDPYKPAPVTSIAIPGRSVGLAHRATSIIIRSEDGTLWIMDVSGGALRRVTVPGTPTQRQTAPPTGAFRAELALGPSYQHFLSDPFIGGFAQLDLGWRSTHADFGAVIAAQAGGHVGGDAFGEISLGIVARGNLTPRLRLGGGVHMGVLLVPRYSDPGAVWASSYLSFAAELLGDVKRLDRGRAIFLGLRAGPRLVIFSTKGGAVDIGPDIRCFLGWRL